MKRCPSCQRSYADDAAPFCVDDGTRLVDVAPAAYDPQKTILASPAPPPAPQYNNPPPQPNMPPPPQPAWPPTPPQGQNWGPGPGYYPQGQAYPPQKSAGLSMAALGVGALSGIIGIMLFASYNGAFRMTRDMAKLLVIVAIVTGVITLALGLIALFSSRQRSKGLAAVGMVLAAFSLGFWIFLEVEYGFLF
ncbi:MAG: hypothetical protein QOJ64_1483 [Acidobacteriota bacterium]|jgi:hypothetical protein|nr:hypothetical protein [Acidobacteriota bacterium]